LTMNSWRISGCERVFIWLHPLVIGRVPVHPVGDWARPDCQHPTPKPYGTASYGPDFGCVRVRFGSLFGVAPTPTP
jgi:hypothetical protein